MYKLSTSRTSVDIFYCFVIQLKMIDQKPRGLYSNNIIMHDFVLNHGRIACRSQKIIIYKVYNGLFHFISNPLPN